MANPKQPDLLKQSVETWNQWRKEHTDVKPNLSFANLGSSNLGSSNLSGANWT